MLLSHCFRQRSITLIGPIVSKTEVDRWINGYLYFEVFTTVDNVYAKSIQSSTILTMTHSTIMYGLIFHAELSHAVGLQSVSILVVFRSSLCLSNAI